MDYKKLNGIWQGTFYYGDRYPLEFQLRSEKFTLDIQFEDVNFKGTCRDRYTDQYFYKPASVEGTFVPNMISFIKKYPSRLSLNEAGENIAGLTEKPDEIHYTGLLYKPIFSRKIRFEGEWIITVRITPENEDGFFYSFSGTWSMSKKC